MAALAGSVAAALGSMVANLTHAKKGFEAVRDPMQRAALECQALKDKLLVAIDADTDAFKDVLAAMRLPKSSDEQRAARESAIQKGYKKATRVPLTTAQHCLGTLRICREVAEAGLPASVTDAGVGGLLARAGVRGAIYNVQINLGSITDSQWVSEIRSQLASMVEECETLEAETRELVAKQIDAQQG